MFWLLTVFVKLLEKQLKLTFRILFCDQEKKTKFGGFQLNDCSSKCCAAVEPL